LVNISVNGMNIQKLIHLPRYKHPMLSSFNRFIFNISESAHCHYAFCFHLAGTAVLERTIFVVT